MKIIYMNTIEKYGCILQSLDLNYINNEINMARSHKKSHNREKPVQKIYKTVRSIDFFLGNEIKIISALNYNRSVNSNAYLNSHYSHYLNTFSSFTPLKISISNPQSTNSTKYNNSNKCGSFNYSAATMACPKLLQYISAIHNPLNFVLSLINVFKSSLNNLTYLKMNDLVHMNMTVDSLSVNPRDNNVLIGNVKFLALSNDLKEEKWLNQFIVGSSSSSSLEQSLLLFLFTNNLNSVSAHHAQTIISSYISDNSFLTHMPQSFKEDYVKHCEKSVAKYINVSKLAIIENILKECCCTWNVFSLSMIFLNIILYLQSVCENICKYGFLNKWMKILLLNVHPDSSKRKTVEDTATIFAKLCYNDPFENFKHVLNELTPDKMLKITGRA
jgi:hypothetical protein